MTARSVRITPHWQKAIETLQRRRGGLHLHELEKELGRPADNIANMLQRMKAHGLVLMVGEGTQSLWGLPGNINPMKARLALIRKASHRKMRRRENERGAVYRAIRGRRRVVNASSVKRHDIPAINSIWSLAA
jgi:DNA-binding IclR family transcriptional regulator